MNSFEEGYEYFRKNSSSTFSAFESNEYVENINAEIAKFSDSIKSMEGYDSSIETLKGNFAEFWHTHTFNIEAALNDSKNRAKVEGSHDYASVDVSTNFGKEYGSKYYKTGIESAKQQAKSIFEKFKEYQSDGGKDSLEEYLKKRGYTDDVVLSDPIYSGQMRLIPTEQMEEAINFLKIKIAKEKIIRPEQVKKYEETLKLLVDKISDNKGNKSITLTNEEAKKFAMLAKEGKFDPSKLGFTTEELVNFEHVMKKAFKAGLSAATISMVLKIGPEIINAVKYLIDNGEIDEEQFKKIGFAAVDGATEGFVKGTLASAITTCCESGIFGEALKELDPSIIGVVTVIAVDTMKNAYKVASGTMTQRELANELVKEMFVSTCSFVGGNVSQMFIEIPVLGFMIGSFAGSVIGTIAYKGLYNPVMSFCVATGFTMFGLVEQNYQLPEDVIKEIGIDVFDYDKFDYTKFEYTKFEYDKFEPTRFDADRIDVQFLRRGVIGVSTVGFI